MRLRIRIPLRHPFFPDWVVTPARVAKGRCAAVSGNFWELVEAAARGVTAVRAVFTINNPENPFLTDSNRDVLWETFQVPILACLLDGDGRLVGYECEAQDGLHIATRCPNGSHREQLLNDDSILGYRMPVDQTVIDSSPCECGRPGQRLHFTSPRPFTRLEVVPLRAQEMALAR